MFKDIEMDLSHFSVNDLITIIVLIAQAGIVYYRLKKVEQSAEKLNELFIAFAVHENKFQNHVHNFEKNSIRVDNNIERLDNRLSGVENQAYAALIKSRKQKQDS